MAARKPAKKPAVKAKAQATPKASAATPRLTKQQRNFALEYNKNGNATAAALKAGYSKSYAEKNAKKIAENSGVKAFLSKLEKQQDATDIATRDERHMFLTRVMNDATEETRDRLKACEILSRANGDFIDNVNNVNSDAPRVVAYLPQKRPKLDE